MAAELLLHGGTGSGGTSSGGTSSGSDISEHRDNERNQNDYRASMDPEGFVQSISAGTLKKDALVTPPRDFHVGIGTLKDTLWEPAYYYNGEFYFVFNEKVYGVVEKKTCDDVTWVDKWRNKMDRVSKANCYFMTFQLSTFENLHSKIEVTSADKLIFFSVLCQAIINATFILSNFALINEYNDSVYRELFIIVIAAEGLLWFTRFSRFAYNIHSLIKRYCTEDETHYQTKNISVHLNALTNISILKYVPCGELIFLLVTRFRETMDQKISYYNYQLKNTEKYKLITKIRVCCEFLLQIFGPFLGIISLLLKLSLLKFATNKLFYEWTFFHFLKFLGFLNQITGMRDINLIELQTIEHFIFSNHRCQLEQKEQTIIQDWWNVTLVSAVAASEPCRRKDIRCIWNSLAFWSSLTREKVEKLLKNQNIELPVISRMQNNQLNNFGNEIQTHYAAIHKSCQKFYN